MITSGTPCGTSEGIANLNVVRVTTPASVSPRGSSKMVSLLGGSSATAREAMRAMAANARRMRQGVTACDYRIIPPTVTK
jgi:hypothetical protein